MKPIEKIEEGGRKALAYNQATRMVVQGFGDKDFYQIGVILAANGHCFEHMRYCVYGDTGSGGIKVPPG
jgi:hypothetical protein